MIEDRRQSAGLATGPARPRSRAVLFVAALSVLVGLTGLGAVGAGCSPGSRRSDAAPSSGTGAATSAAGASSPSASAVVRPPSPRLADPRWIRADDDDPLERARLAEAVGATELLLGVEDGGSIARTALAALPYADDADIALRRLGELALTGGDPGVIPVLEAVLAIAGRPSAAREALDPEGARACGEAMITLAARASLPREARALAVSSARALAEKGYADPARIPADLDPK